MKIGDIVKFSNPVDEDEVKARFILAGEPNVMGRVKIILLPDKYFSEYVHESEIEVAQTI